MRTIIKTVSTSTGNKYYKFSFTQQRLFPIKKIDAELIILLGNYEEFIIY